MTVHQTLTPKESNTFFILKFSIFIPSLAICTCKNNFLSTEIPHLLLQPNSWKDLEVLYVEVFRGLLAWYLYFYICVKTNKCINYFSIYCMVTPTCFGIILPSSGSVPRAFWEMLDWGAIDKILKMGVLCLVAWCGWSPIYNILSTAPQLSISQKALRTLPEDGNIMPKHVGATIHN
jgi:hypothetical protein